MYSSRNRNSSLKVEKLAYGSNYRSSIVGRTRQMSKLRFTNHNTDLRIKISHRQNEKEINYFILVHL